MRVHSKEKPYICSYPGCGQSFPNKASLKYHLTKHEDGGDFVKSELSESEKSVATQDNTGFSTDAENVKLETQSNPMKDAELED